MSPYGSCSIFVIIFDANVEFLLISASELHRLLKTIDVMILYTIMELPASVAESLIFWVVIKQIQVNYYRTGG